LVVAFAGRDQETATRAQKLLHVVAVEHDLKLG
jgi:hypothetical protein